jgi:DNA-binding MarR family transcriptional regulator
MTAPANAPALSLDRFLPYRLSVLANTVSSALAGAYALRFGLTIPQWRVIAVLARTPGLAAADVVERTAMDKVAVSRAVAGLARTGRLRRATAAGDRRRSVLSLTERGWSVYRRIVPLALAYEPPARRARRTSRRNLRRCSHGCSSGPGVSVPLAMRVYNPRRHATAKAI